ncbi:hypothetical protein Pla52n_00820 [Stieleria varia]|uniref:Uncharacterized protein n=1 Tax=Stieleria varia TaxID=2528005 RepID=A0A5C6B891_9BACT|nr:hypothetical protein Pla52n_00820 [Stieleria varia]
MNYESLYQSKPASQNEREGGAEGLSVKNILLDTEAS